MEYIVAHLDQILSIIGLVVAWLLARPWAKEKQAAAEAWMKKTNTEQVWQIVVGVVAQLYTESVREMKAAGTFNDAMKAKIAARAIELIKAEVKEHGLQIATSALPGLVEMAVSFLKAKGVAGASAPFSGESSRISDYVQGPELGAATVPGLP